jgi:hypothetical protein
LICSRRSRQFVSQHCATCATLCYLVLCWDRNARQATDSSSSGSAVAPPASG